jgi:hypothetical protein
VDAVSKKGKNKSRTVSSKSKTGWVLTISALFLGPIVLILSRLASMADLYFYPLYGLLFGPFVVGLIIWAIRCSTPYNKENRKLIRILWCFFVTMSFIMLLSVTFLLVLLNGLYLAAFSLFLIVVAWEGVSEGVRKAL